MAQYFLNIPRTFIKSDRSICWVCYWTYILFIRQPFEESKQNASFDFCSLYTIFQQKRKTVLTADAMPRPRILIVQTHYTFYYKRSTD